MNISEIYKNMTDIMEGKCDDIWLYMVIDKSKIKDIIVDIDDYDALNPYLDDCQGSHEILKINIKDININYDAYTNESYISGGIVSILDYNGNIVLNSGDVSHIVHTKNKSYDTYNVIEEEKKKELIRRGLLICAGNIYPFEFIPFKINFNRGDNLPIFKDLDSSLNYISSLTINAK